MDNKGVIYILTNPSFPQYVKIGYADDVNERVAQLNRSECTPFGFRIFATYEVSDRLKDIPVHNLIDSLNPTLRSRDEIDGKPRVREFYAMTPEEALQILTSIAKINGLEDRITVYSKTKDQIEDEETAKEITELSNNRHHFREVEFSCSLTNRRYKGFTRNDGTLGILDLESNAEIPNNSNPSKKAIVGQAIIDLGGKTDKNETLYQRYHKLMKLTY